MTQPQTHLEISSARHDLENARLEMMKTLMVEYDKGHYAALKVLREECERIGHNWRFSNFGPLGHSWYHCTVCSASRVEDE